MTIEPHTVSANHVSTDGQVVHALDYLRTDHPEAYCAVRRHFPETFHMTYDGSWFDTDKMGVDPEFGSWLVEAIEATGFVQWDEGEPWACGPDGWPEGWPDTDTDG